MPNPDGQWITINYVNYFTLYGGGVLDGKGQDAWKANDCNTNKNCAKLPINLSLNFINNTIIHDITVKDSKNFQVNCISSHNVTFHNFHISAPGESINTDGIHIARSTSIKVIDSIIETGDDCISIGDESQDYHIQNVTCGPGHGISIGSLGKGAEEKDVTGITVIDCKFKQTQNGVRVKTWPSAPATLKDPSKIQISNVNIKNIKGTSNTKEVVILACSASHPCKDVTVADIDVSYVGSVAANALLSAWKEATAANTSSKVFIPPGKWTLSQVVLVGGTNKSPIELVVQGTLEAYSRFKENAQPRWSMDYYQLRQSFHPLRWWSFGRQGPRSLEAKRLQQK
ncbi:hypothetical protein DH2020_009545 [Rehmannia glutinosa]|uniref:Polygalacturonase n=1 Tax=Rehmannia glutinosa TaxID=99300 RepID=A0ABR0X6M2_REHGL